VSRSSSSAVKPCLLTDDLLNAKDVLKDSTSPGLRQLHVLEIGSLKWLARLPPSIGFFDVETTGFYESDRIVTFAGIGLNPTTNKARTPAPAASEEEARSNGAYIATH
jgi:hypothetical protein